MSKQVFIIDSYQKTQSLGEKIAKKLTGGEVLALHGNLGGGKTTFVQGLAKGLGIKRRIISPTFVIVRTYNLKLQNAKRFYHIDLFRVESQKDIKMLGVEEIINDPKNIIVIEWAERLGELYLRRGLIFILNIYQIINEK